MNKDLVEKLKSCKSIVLPDNINEINSFIIQKKQIPLVEIGGCYQVSFDQSMLNITHQFFNSIQDIEVVDIQDDKIKIFSPLWDGWITSNAINIIKKY